MPGLCHVPRTASNFCGTYLDTAGSIVSRLEVDLYSDTVCLVTLSCLMIVPSYTFLPDVMTAYLYWHLYWPLYRFHFTIHIVSAIITLGGGKTAILSLSLTKWSHFLRLDNPFFFCEIKLNLRPSALDPSVSFAPVFLLNSPSIFCQPLPGL